MEREQCWLGPVGRKVSLIKLLHSTVQENSVFAKGPDSFSLGWEVSLLIGPDTTSPRMGNILANRAGFYIY